jgi:hypothetical protein
VDWLKRRDPVNTVAKPMDSHKARKVSTSGDSINCSRRTLVCRVCSLSFCLLFCSVYLRFSISASPAMCQRPQLSLIYECKCIFCNMTPCQMENIYRHFESFWCLYLEGLKQCLFLGFLFPEYGGSKLFVKSWKWRKKAFRNVVNYLQTEKASYLTRLESSLTPLW